MHCAMLPPGEDFFFVWEEHKDLKVQGPDRDGVMVVADRIKDPLTEASLPRNREGPEDKPRQ